MTAALDTRSHFPPAAQTLSPEDFETASIRSAAPSYISEAPSYHSNAPISESIPPYTPPGTAQTSHSTNTRQPLGSPSTSMIPESYSQHQTIGLPPIPPPGSAAPTLSSFRIPTWSVVHSNPTYQNVARRRAQSDANDHVASLRRAFFLERVAEDEDASPSSSAAAAASPATTPESSSSSHPRRPLEDPHLVGEAAAAQARRTRLARERGQEILLAEDRQWNWFLAQMGSWEERERSWARFRAEVDSRQHRRLSRRLAGRLF